MPSGINFGRMDVILDGLRALGVDNINLFVNAERNNVCDVGWGNLRVRGIGVDADAAIVDADTKIRAAIAAAFPNETLPG